MIVLAFVVRGLYQPESIVDAVRRLGERHAHYGVQPHHYATVGEALLWTLEQLFGPAFTPQVAEAWSEAYQLLAGLMREAAGPTMRKQTQPQRQGRESYGDSLQIHGAPRT